MHVAGSNSTHHSLQNTTSLEYLYSPMPRATAILYLYTSSNNATEPTHANTNNKYKDNNRFTNPTTVPSSPTRRNPHPKPSKQLRQSGNGARKAGMQAQSTRANAGEGETKVQKW
jgi:hypothetical protein